ncbi:MAG: DUF3800 domain-containing protein [Candidatus Moraniibacteriota bacterium]
MHYLYLDESGDLGFDFVNKKPSKFFTVTVLVVDGRDANRKLTIAAKKTLARKLNQRSTRKRIIREIKGSETTLMIKRYLYQQIRDIPFDIYSITLDKKRLFERLSEDKERVYNFVARQVIDAIPFERMCNDRIEMIFDRCKGKVQIEEFNGYIRNQLEARIDPGIPIDMYHQRSHENYGLQICDVFCYGIFQKYERKETAWYDVYAQEKIRFEKPYVLEKNKNPLAGKCAS